MNENTSSICYELLKKFNSNPQDSNILITDLESVQFVFSYEKQTDVDFKEYIHKKISKDLIELATEWKNKTFSKDLFLTLDSKTVKNLIQNDNAQYVAQMIFPLFNNDILDGFAIVFKTNSAFTKEIEKFIQEELMKNSLLRK